MHAKLIVVGGKANAAEIKLKLPALVGRGRDADLTVAHSTVSRRHCMLEELEGALVVRDIGSLNGTVIEGTRVQQAVVRPGQMLTIGPLTFRVEYKHKGSFPTLGDKPAGEAAAQLADTPAEFMPTATQMPVQPTPLDPLSLDEDRKDAQAGEQQAGEQPAGAAASPAADDPLDLDDPLNLDEAWDIASTPDAEQSDFDLAVDERQAAPANDRPGTAKPAKAKAAPAPPDDPLDLDDQVLEFMTDDEPAPARPAPKQTKGAAAAKGESKATAKPSKSSASDDDDFFESLGLN